jgi:tetratricopeptide (TPR) repeat protein
MKEEKAKKTKGRVQTLAGTIKAGPDPARTRLLHHYEMAMKLLQEGKVERAKPAFEAILKDGAGELAERVRVHLSACDRQINQKNISFGSLEERYDYAVSLINTGYYEDAREHLEAILQADPRADFAHYGLAVLEGLTGRAEACLEHLGEAVRLQPRNRIQARCDSDFQEMADDPRFTELLYPEIS